MTSSSSFTSPSGSSGSGWFIVLEGVDGSGTTTQSRRLVEALSARGHAAEATFEPSTGPIGRFIRSVLERRLLVEGSSEPWKARWSTLALLFAADRLDHVDTAILPALAARKVVVSDRYDLSSLAYQSVTAEDASVLPWIRELNRYALRPRLTLVLDVPFAEASRRRKARGGSEEIFDADSIQARLVTAYARAEELVPGDALVHIDGTGDAEAVTERILAAVLAAIPEL
jgi:dTMP kinase